MNYSANKIGRTFLLLGLILGAMLLAGLAYTQIVTRSSDDTLNLQDNLTDMSFFAAKDLKVMVDSTDDVFAFGEEINVTKTRADHLVLAGGRISLNGVNLKDLIMAAGKINLVRGQVDDDIIVAAETLDIEKSFAIGGSAMLAAETLNITTPIGVDLRAAAETLTLTADVAGDAHLYGETVTIGPNVRIGGNLRYRAEDLEMDPTAEIMGSITKLENHDAPDRFEKWGRKAITVIAVFALAVALGIAILIGVSVAVFPGLMTKTSKMITEKPLQSVGIGFLTVVIGPVLLMVLLATILGIPLALLIGAFYLVAAPLALAAFAYFAGMRGRQIFTKKSGEAPNLATRILWSLLATLALFIIGIIPLIGGLVWFVAYVFGMGAVIVQGYKALARPA